MGRKRNGTEKGLRGGGSSTRCVDGEVTRRRRIDDVPVLAVALVGGSGSEEALQHRGAEMEVRLGRNDRKGARR
jgi:hypothetical protein